MDGMPDSNSDISWHWVIEALANFKEVDPSLLHDLLQVVPGFPDGLGSNVKEIIAFRCLEGLFSSSKGITGDGGPKVAFDLSETCDSVLQRILQETPLSNQGTNGENLSKWDVHPFIMHKRASMPKCTLLELKDAVVDGTCPYAAAFLKEISGISFENGVNRIHNEPQKIQSEVSDSPDIAANKSKCMSEHYFQFQVPNSSSSSGPLQKDIDGEAEKDVDCCRCKTKVLSDIDDYQNERIDVAKKKHYFLSSQCTVTPIRIVHREISSHDSLTIADWTGQNLCMKCNKGGQLLICSVSSCPLVFHEDCLGFSSRFDDKGDYYCPFCTYSLAITEYLEAKKEASLAMKKVAILFCRDLKNRKEEFSDSVDKKACTSTRTNTGDDFIVKSRENECLGQIEDNHEKQQINELGNFQSINIVIDKQQAESSISCQIINLECGEKGTAVTSATLHVPAAEKEEDLGVQECFYVKDHEREQNQVLACGDHDSNGDISMVPIDQRPSNLEIQLELPKQSKNDAPECAMHAFNIDGDEGGTSEDDNDHSKYFIQIRQTTDELGVIFRIFVL